MQRLSQPPDRMRDHYSVVVVGSGYGGAITAARIAHVGRDVCVLERGKELHPGEYPNSALTGLGEVQVHAPAAHHGSTTAMFDFHTGPDITVLVGCGLGGTSLINANVALEPGDPTLSAERWPTELRDAGELRHYMSVAKDMLGSNPYPLTSPQLPKLHALNQIAASLGRELTRPPINVTFEAGPNAAGVVQNACTLCGDCCSGCNQGAKNTVLMNYLPYAYAHGAEIFTEVAVRSVHREHGQWRVVFDVLGEGRERYRDAPSQFVTADVVVLAAGTLGSTEILLRSRALGLPVSGRLGHRFSGNGDVLAFAYDTGQSVRGVGLGRRLPRKGRLVGPTITGLIDLTEGVNPLIIEDGAIPGVLAALLPTAMYAASYGNPDWPKAPLDRRLRELAQIPLGAYRGPTDRTLTYLVMSTDSSGGEIVLENDRIHVDWPDVAEEPVFERDNEVLTLATDALHGSLVPDPLWAWTNGRSLITVHPLGGCVMADNKAEGVVDHKCRVFDPTGDGVHEGLYVADGSVVPLALDVNPLLTISAIAERAAKLMIEDRNWATTEPGGPPAPPPPPAMEAAVRARLTFTERLTGFVSARVRDDPEAGGPLADLGPGDFQEGFEAGREDGAIVTLCLTIDYDDVEAVLSDTTRPARISGTAIAPELSPHRLTVQDGHFTLLDPDPSHVETWHMRYRMELLAEDGSRYAFDGHKVIRRHGARYAWSDTTTLYTTIQQIDGAEKRRVGIVHLEPIDFTRLLRSIEVRDVPYRKQIEYRLAFLELFAGEMVHIYGGVLDEASAFPIASMEKDPPVREPRHPDEMWFRDSATKDWHGGDRPGDHDFLRLVRYRAGSKGPVILATGFGMSSHSFLAPTIETNLAEFLAHLGYDIWLFDYRAGIDLHSAQTPFTIDDIVQKDWPLAVEKVLERTDRDDVQAFGHCVGSVSLQMAILNGMTGIRSAVCAQFPMHPATSVFNWVKSELRVGDVIEGFGLNVLAPDNVPSPPNALVDAALRTLPIPPQERCGQAVCRWINAIYGCTHRHAQLNDDTHRALNDMFGVGSITALKHLTLMLRRSLAVTHDGKSTYLDNPERMADTKLLLLQGRHNYIFHTAGTLRTLRWLQRNNPGGDYRRVVLPGYAHLDAIVGANAADDVYPHIAGFLDETQ